MVTGTMVISNWLLDKIVISSLFDTVLISDWLWVKMVISN